MCTSRQPARIIISSRGVWPQKCIFYCNSSRARGTRPEIGGPSRGVSLRALPLSSAHANIRRNRVRLTDPPSATKEDTLFDFLFRAPFRVPRRREYRPVSRYALAVTYCNANKQEYSFLWDVRTRRSFI